MEISALEEGEWVNGQPYPSKESLIVIEWDSQPVWSLCRSDEILHLLEFESPIIWTRAQSLYSLLCTGSREKYKKVGTHCKN